METSPVKGMKDRLGREMLTRREIMEKIRSAFLRFGFEEALTPAVERLEVLEGKYGEEEKLIWKFQDLGGRWVALKYDQTVPLARIVAKYRPKMPFRRFTIDRAWRYENPQKGRLREFWQADADIVGEPEGLADAEVLALASHVMKVLGFHDFRIRVNHRGLLDSVLDEIGVRKKRGALISLDKMDKIGKAGVLAEMERRGIPREKAEALLEYDAFDKHEEFRVLQNLMDLSKRMGAENLEFDFSLARGLDYYTGMIVEIEASKEIGSVGGGGRYDSLLGLFGQPHPAVGISFGIDRLAEILDAESSRTGSILCSFASEEYTAEVLGLLRKKMDISAIYGRKIKKMLSYASDKGFREAYIIGPEEERSRVVRIKDLETGEEKTLGLEKV